MNKRKHHVWDGSDWNDGYITVKGRFLVYHPEYPRARSGGYAFRSHIVWWLHHGTVVPTEMVIHHKNGDRLDDDIDNLEMMGRGDHTVLHHSLPGAEITCVKCGMPFSVPSWRLRERAKRGGAVKFCSNDCRCASPKGGPKNNNLVCVTGGAGFVGHWLIRYLKEHGFRVRAVDIRQPEFSLPNEADENWWACDLRNYDNALAAAVGCSHVYALAATMGGAGFSFTGQHDLEIIRDNTLINANTLEAAAQSGVERYFFSSSACIYNQNLQTALDAASLKEEDAYPAWPDSAYGWEKLHAEHLCRYYNGIGGMSTHVARFHNCHGPEGQYQGGKEKCPAAMCRKVAVAKLTGNPEVEIWGDGEATRSYMYIDDCLDGIYELMLSQHTAPINLGTDRAVSVNELVDIIADIAGVKVVKKYVDGPQGVRGRNADLTKVKEVLGWEPKVSLEEGLARTYAWIESQVEQTLMEMYYD